jgi:hypothetical protein
MEKESVKIDKELMRQVRDRVKKQRGNYSGFVELAIEEKLASDIGAAKSRQNKKK